MYLMRAYELIWIGENVVYVVRIICEEVFFFGCVVYIIIEATD